MARRLTTAPADAGEGAVTAAWTRTRPFALDVGELTLSGLLAKPDGASRALVVALHGHGMTARYFAGPADQGLSLLELGAALGFTVWAPDRPGYGRAADADPHVLAMFPQAALLTRAVDRLGSHIDVGAGCFLVGHSFGLKLALTMASEPGEVPLLGIDGSGSGLQYAFEPGRTRPVPRRGDVNASWGPRALYPAATFTRGVMPVAPMAHAPPNEVVEWPDDFRRIAGRIRVPVRFTFGEHDRLWTVDRAHAEQLAAVLVASPRVVVDVQRGAGHNVSLSHAGRAYHLKALAFAEECVLAAQSDAAGRPNE